MTTSQESTTRLLQRFGDHDLSLGIVSPVALYDIWLSDAGLSVPALDQATEPHLTTALTKLDDLIDDPSTLVTEQAWRHGDVESHRAHVRAMLVARREVARSRRLTVSPHPTDADLTATVADLRDLLRHTESVLAELRSANATTPVTPRDDLEAMERRWSLLGRLLAKEFVATVIGGLLLLGLAAALVLAMFLDQPATEIVSSSFLLILGYFFGNHVTTRQPQKSAQPRRQAENTPARPDPNARTRT